jgi:hypothetical protein
VCDQVNKCRRRGMYPVEGVLGGLQQALVFVGDIMRAARLTGSVFVGDIASSEEYLNPRYGQIHSCPQLQEG